MKKLARIALWSSFLSIIVSFQSSLFAQVPNEDHLVGVKNRIDKVIHGLLPETSFKGKFKEPSLLADRMRYFHTPGVSIAVINNFQIEWAKGFGILESGKKAPVTEKTLFQAGSISKPVFAMAIMKLVQEGKLDLDEDVNHYLISWKVPPSGSWQPRVTLRQIFSHSAGFTVHGFPGYPRGQRAPSLVDILNGRGSANTPSIEVSLLPGTQFRYSGGGTTVAQQLAVDFLKKPFPKIMNDLVFSPLTLKNSTFEQPLPPHRAKQAATAHPFEGQVLPGKWHIYPEMAAAGLWTTPTDLAKIGLELQLTLKEEKDRLLSQKSVAEMLTPGKNEQIGIGFFLNGKGKNVRFSHTGGDAGFMAIATFYKDLGKGAVIMINSNEGMPILGEIERSIAKVYEWPEYFEESKKVAKISEKQLKSLTGDYSTQSGISMKISEENSHLFLKLGDQPSLEIKPESETKFFSEDINLGVIFEKDSKGKIKALTLQQDSGPLTAERK